MGWSDNEGSAQTSPPNCPPATRITRASNKRRWTGPDFINLSQTVLVRGKNNNNIGILPNNWSQKMMFWIAKTGGHLWDDTAAACLVITSQRKVKKWPSRCWLHLTSWQNISANKQSLSPSQHLPCYWSYSYHLQGFQKYQVTKPPDLWWGGIYDCRTSYWCSSSDMKKQVLWHFKDLTDDLPVIGMDQRWSRTHHNVVLLFGNAHI